MRCFLGLPVSDVLHRQRQVAGASVLNQRQVSWETAADWHLTLVFLGETDQATLASLVPAVAAVCRRARPFVQPLAGPAPFPSADSPLLALEGEAVAELAWLHQQLVQVCAAVGIVPETRRFRPHVTLARQHAAGPLEGFSCELLAERVALFLSGPPDAAGRRYTELASWELGGSVPSA